MKIRRLRADDWEKVHEGMQELHALHVHGRPDVYAPRDPVLPDAVFREMCADPGHVLFGSEEAELTGFAMASVKERSFMVPMRTLYLENLFVFPGFRRRGAASALMLAMETAGREMGCARMELMVWDFNGEAAEFYRHSGYRCQRLILEKSLSKGEKT